MNLSELLTNQARERGERPFSVWHDQTMTYAQVDQAAARLAAGLAEQGIGRGDVVALLIPNIPPYLISFFALQKLGAIVLPLNLLLRPAEVAYILNDSGAKMVIALDMMLPLVDGARSKVSRVEKFVVIGANVPDWAIAYQSMAGGDPAALPAMSIDENEICTLMYTSGTTGAPKGAMISHKNFIHQGKMMQGIFDLTESDRSLLVLPMFHIFGLAVVTMGALVSGSALVLQEKFDPDAVLRELVTKEVTMMYAVPTMYIALLQQAEGGGYELPKTLRACLCGAAPLPVETCRHFEKAFNTVIVEGYGLTEATGATCVNPWNGQVKVGSIGPVIPGNDMKIVDPDAQELPPGEIGEIVIRGDNIMKGYLNKPEATAESIRDGWFFTGDLATMDEDGYFTIMDRKKDLIIVGGENVYPREVEEAIYQFPGVLEAVVVKMPHPKMVEVPRAVIVLKPGAEASEEDVIAFLGERLAKFKIPRTIEFRPELPKSGTGKILRRVLRDE